MNPGSIARWGELLAVRRVPAGLQLAFSCPFVPGNVVTLAVNGLAIAPVAFTVDSPTTLAALAQAIAATQGVDSAQADGAVIVVQNPRSVAITDIIVTGGASQPTASVTGGHVNGIWVPAAAIAFQVKALVQPKSLRTLEREQLLLPEGVRTRATIELLTAVPLQTAGEGQGQVADVVSWRGVDYQVQQTTCWDQGTLKHYESLAAKLEQES